MRCPYCLPCLLNYSDLWQAFAWLFLSYALGGLAGMYFTLKHKGGKGQ